MEPDFDPVQQGNAAIARVADDSSTLTVNSAEPRKKKKLPNLTESFSPRAAVSLKCAETASLCS